MAPWNPDFVDVLCDMPPSIVVTRARRSIARGGLSQKPGLRGTRMRLRRRGPARWRAPASRRRSHANARGTPSPPRSPARGWPRPARSGSSRTRRRARGWGSSRRAPRRARRAAARGPAASGATGSGRAAPFDRHAARAGPCVGLVDAEELERHRHAVAREAVAPAREQRHLLDARRAPGGPEVHPASSRRAAAPARRRSRRAAAAAAARSSAARPRRRRARSARRRRAPRRRPRRPAFARPRTARAARSPRRATRRSAAAAQPEERGGGERAPLRSHSRSRRRRRCG